MQRSRSQIPKERAVGAVDFAMGKAVSGGSARREAEGGWRKGVGGSVVRWNGLRLELDSPFVGVSRLRCIVRFINLPYQKHYENTILHGLGGQWMQLCIDGKEIRLGVRVQKAFLLRDHLCQSPQAHGRFDTVIQQASSD